mgnify:CR=1 FL=1
MDTIGKPELKNRDECNSFTYNQSGFKLIEMIDIMAKDWLH